MSLIKPILCYALNIWNPHQITQYKRLEQVQHRFLRTLAYKSGTPMQKIEHDYTNISKKYNVYTLKSVYDYYDILFLYKLIRNLIDSPQLLEKVNFRVSARIMRTQRVSFNPKLLKNDLNYKAPISRMCLISNKNSDICDFFNTNISIFKKLAKSKILTLST